jgi:tRNA-dihydrouridine synthase A
MTLSLARKFSIAPMMDWTDRHCRHFHSRIAPGALLFTEMVTADAVIHGDRDRLLAQAPEDINAGVPVALQLGGSDPDRLAEATNLAAGYGYAEINLNVGCPSDRVQSGRFGAVPAP